MSEFETFSKAISRAASQIALVAFNDGRPQMERWLASAIAGTAPPARVSSPVMSPRDTLIVRLFAGFIEISSSVGTLDTFRRLAMRSPPKAIGVTKETHLRVLVESYLAEAYILALRLETYLVSIKRMYKNTAAEAEASTMVANMLPVVKTAFQGIVQVRGAHVHVERHDDDELGRLTTLELLARNEPRFRSFRNSAFREVSRRKIKWMADNNQSIRLLLDSYFGSVATVVLISDGTVRTLPKLANKRLLPTATREKMSRRG